VQQPLKQKVKENQVTRNASLPHKAFAPQIRQNLGYNLLTLLRSHEPALQPKAAMPSPTLMATIVLPYFTRSCSADGRKK